MIILQGGCGEIVTSQQDRVPIDHDNLRMSSNTGRIESNSYPVPLQSSRRFSIMFVDRRGRILSSFQENVLLLVRISICSALCRGSFLCIHLF